MRFQGGLGNQIYAYVFYEWLKAYKTDCRVLADLTYYKIRMAHNSLPFWEVFPNAKVDKASYWDIFKYSGQIPLIYEGKGADRLNALRCKINKKFFSKRGHAFVCPTNNTSESEMKEIVAKGFLYLEGFWQNTDYWLKMKKDILGKIRFNEEYDKYVEQGMLKKNAVSIHVRRGDYVGTRYEQEVNMSYYRKAVQIIEQKVSNPVYYIFSDDKDYAENAFDWLQNKKVVKGYDEKKAHIDMCLMSRFHNSIIANSTFSVWSAYLNVNENPLIVYPDVDFMRHKAMPEWTKISK